MSTIADELAKFANDSEEQAEVETNPRIELTEAECETRSFMDCIRLHAERSGYALGVMTKEECEKMAHQLVKSIKHVMMGDRKVPRFDSFDDLIMEGIPEPKRIIDGILGKGQKMSVNAG